MINFIDHIKAAVDVTADLPAEGISGLAKQFGGTEADLGSIVDLIQKVIDYALAFAGVAALFMFLWGGVFNYVTSFGNEEKIKKATQTMVWSLLGLVIIGISYTIKNIISSVLK